MSQFSFFVVCYQIKHPCLLRLTRRSLLLRLLSPACQALASYDPCSTAFFCYFSLFPRVCITPPLNNGMLQCMHCLELSRPRLNRSPHWCPGPTTPWSKNRAPYMSPRVHFYRLLYDSLVFWSLFFPTLVFDSITRLLAVFEFCFRLCNARPACLCGMLIRDHQEISNYRRRSLRQD